MEPWSLFVDTSTLKGRLAIVDPVSFKVLKSTHWGKEERHSEVLIKYFDELKKKFLIKNLTTIYCLQGPGSFTGLRVCAAFLKTISFAAKDVEIISISSFAPIAKSLSEAKTQLNSFKVFIPSIGNKAFKSNFNLQGTSFTEEIDFNGASELHIDEEGYTSDKGLAEKSNLTLIEHPTLKNALDCFKDTPRFQFYKKSSTYLDFYPLYLRKSEAEEKYRYDTLIQKKT